MSPKKRQPQADAARLEVLAANGDERAFAEVARDVLANGGRLVRERALEIIARQPRPALRDALRDLYAELDADGAKRDQGARMRVAIVRALTEIGDVRDADIALAASGCYEVILGEDLTAGLRMYGLRMLARLDPALFRFVAAETIEATEQRSPKPPVEPAKVAFELLAQLEEWTLIYDWLLREHRDLELQAFVLELFTGGPRPAVERYVRRTLADAVAREQEATVMALADAVVRLRLDALYGALATTLRARISDELYGYLAMLLAGAGEERLLAVLEEELHGGRRPRVVAEALRLRPRPETEALLRRWEAGERQESCADPALVRSRRRGGT
jgi:hypothetical protein